MKLPVIFIIGLFFMLFSCKSTNDPEPKEKPIPEGFSLKINGENYTSDNCLCLYARGSTTGSSGQTEYISLLAIQETGFFKNDSIIFIFYAYASTQNLAPTTYNSTSQTNMFQGVIEMKKNNRWYYFYSTEKNGSGSIKIRGVNTERASGEFICSAYRADTNDSLKVVDGLFNLEVQMGTIYIYSAKIEKLFNSQMFFAPDGYIDRSLRRNPTAQSVAD